MTESHNTERDHALSLLRRFGRNTTSFQILEPGLRYWFSARQEACVAYAESGRSWVVAGQPVCAPESTAVVVAEFTAYAKRCHRRLRWFCVEAEFNKYTHGAKMLHIGEQPVWCPSDWPVYLRRKRSLREQLRRARAKGIGIRQLSAAHITGSYADRIEQLRTRWLAIKNMAAMGFLVHVDIRCFAAERLVFVAEKNNELVGLLSAVPVYARDAWFIEDLLRDPQAPNGTVEILFDQAMKHCQHLGTERVCFGLAPLANTPYGQLRWIRDHTRWLYDFAGLYQFKSKLGPTSWESVYLCCSTHEYGVVAIIDSLRAFAGGNFLRFGWRSILHRLRRYRDILHISSFCITKRRAPSPSHIKTLRASNVC